MRAVTGTIRLLKPASGETAQLLDRVGHNARRDGASAGHDCHVLAAGAVPLDVAALTWLLCAVVLTKSPLDSSISHRTSHAENATGLATWCQISLDTCCQPRNATSLAIADACDVLPLEGCSSDGAELADTALSWLSDTEISLLNCRPEVETAAADGIMRDVNCMMAGRSLLAIRNDFSN